MGTRSKLLRNYLCLSLPLTAIAIVLNLVSLDRVRQLLPEYPLSMTLGLYMPLPPAVFFHQLGVVGLIGMLVVFATATVLLMRSEHRRLALASVVSHVTLLSLAIASYGWCMFRLARVLENWPR